MKDSGYKNILVPIIQSGILNQNQNPSSHWIRCGLFNDFVVSHILILLFFLVCPNVPQIETIGDAYCVAGGLHKKVDSHAKPIAHMALKMMELSEEVLTPDGKPIKVSSHSC